MNRYRSSINDQKAEAFLGCFSPAYPDSFLFGEPAEKQIRMELSGSHPPGLKISDQKIEFGSGQARVSLRYFLSRISAGQGRQDQGREELILKRGPEGWRIESGSAIYQILAGRDREEDEIRALLQKRVQALREKDLELFRGLVDPQYNFSGKNFELVVAGMENTFNNYQRIELTLDPPKLTFFPGRADLVEGFRLRAWSQEKPVEFNDTEKLGLTRTGQGWKISKGL